MSYAPVFLRPIPRSGGTLFVTLLDAHPEIAMSYEIYEDKLVSDAGTPLSLDSVLEDIDDATARPIPEAKRIKHLPDKHLQTFLFRARRGGLSLAEVRDTMAAQKHRGCKLDTQAGRLDLIEALMKLKAEKAEKTIWGGKLDTNPRVLHQRYPDAAFFVMVRDVRDVYASISTTGNFAHTPETAATLWKERILDFRSFATQTRANAVEICYERLVREPEKALREVCARIGVAYAKDMLQFHKKDMTLFRNPHGHLSAQQLTEGLNTKSIGRWRRDLRAGEARKIMAITRDCSNETAL